jgi:hypothetical protein
MHVMYSLRHTMINHCDRRITHLSDTSITVIYHAMSLTVLYVSDQVIVALNAK